MQKLQDNDSRIKKKELDQQIQQTPIVAPIKRSSLKTNSEDDDLQKVKKQNKLTPVTPSTSSTTAISGTDTKPKVDRVNALKYNTATDDSDDSRHSSPTRRTATPKQSVDVSFSKKSFTHF